MPHYTRLSSRRQRENAKRKLPSSLMNLRTLSFKISQEGSNSNTVWGLRFIFRPFLPCGAAVNGPVTPRKKTPDLSLQSCSCLCTMSKTTTSDTLAQLLDFVSDAKSAKSERGLNQWLNPMQHHLQLGPSSREYGRSCVFCLDRQDLQSCGDYYYDAGLLEERTHASTLNHRALLTVLSPILTSAEPEERCRVRVGRRSRHGGAGLVADVDSHNDELSVQGAVPRSWCIVVVCVKSSSCVVQCNTRVGVVIGRSW